ncbi:MAG TPA: SH3 domain-containing protein [Gemmatimonadaceae bacterium]|nr:SH3 domain-containing protein [Gemmatimonadaceae bacterium]
MRFRFGFLAMLLAAAAAAPVCAQGLTGPAVLYARPGAGELATVARGTTLDPGAASGEYVRVTLRGYLASSLVGSARDSFPASVAGSDARLRGAPSTSAAVVASLQQGMAFHVVKRAGAWTQVERAGWIRRSAFPAALLQQGARKTAPKRPEAKAPQASSKPAPARPAAAAPVPKDTASQIVPVDSAAANGVTPADSVAMLSPAPGVAPIATVRHGAVLTPVARLRGWVRVRLDGWMREQDLAAADTAMARLSAADLQANPDAYVGRVVHWTVTALAFQTADPLRHDMRPDEPYLLARGPGKENALLYLALPAGLVDEAKGLAPMTVLSISAKVRTGRSDPSGVPILDVQNMAKR